MIIVAAPSGAGKSSFVERICREDSRLVDVITCTTRPMRSGERNGQPYYFFTIEEFERRNREGYFVESARVHNNWYGTPRDQIELAWHRGRAVIMDIDVQGARTFKSKYPECKSIFILPPSLEELRRRVVRRDGPKPMDLDLRMQNATREMAEASSFDYQLVNDEFEASFAQFKKIVDELLGSR